MMTSLEEALVTVWRQALIENKKTVALEDDMGSDLRGDDLDSSSYQLFKLRSHIL